MSVTDRSRPSAELPLEELPEFRLTCLFDDEENPSEVTVFPASNGPDLSTRWITVDAGSAVPLESVR